MKLTMSEILNQYANIQTNFKKIKLIFGHKNWHQKLKVGVFRHPSIKRCNRYQKILWGYSFRCKNILNFTSLTINFQNCHHSSMHLINMPFLTPLPFEKKDTLKRQSKSKERSYFLVSVKYGKITKMNFYFKSLQKL